MKHKYTIKHNTFMRVMFAVLLIILLIGLIVNTITMVNNIKQEASVIFTVSWTVLIAIQLIAILVLMLNCKYIVSDKYFTVVFGFIFKRVPIAEIKLLRQDKENNMLLLYYHIVRKGNELINYHAININPKIFDAFIDDIKGKNPSVIYENFDIYKQSEE